VGSTLIVVDKALEVALATLGEPTLSTPGSSCATLPWEESIFTQALVCFLETISEFSIASDEVELHRASLILCQAIKGDLGHEERMRVRSSIIQGHHALVNEYWADDSEDPLPKIWLMSGIQAFTRDLMFTISLNEKIGQALRVLERKIGK